MKYKVVAVISTILALQGCDELSLTSVEEYKSRVKYCQDSGFDYETMQNGADHTRVYCTKDGKRFESKWEKSK
ncbi:hypothetical protein D3C86_1490960 [compost metagenome]